MTPSIGPEMSACGDDALAAIPSVWWLVFFKRVFSLRQNLFFDVKLAAVLDKKT